ncbi:MAG: FHA domain-containing protein, partial [Firmicutes bacterium]|nr:FHA domain-containing protein [Bacillota bacterium]
MKLLESINQLLHEFVTTFTAFFVTIEEFLAHYVVATELFTLAVRWILPLLALLLFFRCIWPLLQVGKEKELWGQLRLSDDTYIPLKHWENLLGRSKFSDIVINLPFVSRSHAVLSFRNGIWSIVDLGSKGGVKVNKTKIEKQEVVNYGDTISLAGADMTLIATD